MKAIMKREFKNYLKNPIFWIGFFFAALELYQMLCPYFKIHYFQSESEIQEIAPEQIGDADIMDGYVLSTKEKQMELTCEKIKEDMIEEWEMTEKEVNKIIDEMLKKDMSIQEMEAYLEENYDFYGKYGIQYYYTISEIHKGDKKEANSYIADNLKKHSFSYYFARKFADFCGLFMGFFCTILLAFLFIRDSKRDIYELLHTKPISSFQYIAGKVGGGFVSMLFIWGLLTLLFGLLCEIHGLKNGFPVRFFEFLWPAVIYILPNMFMIVCVYTITAIVFKNPLPAVPFLFLYMVYSNMGSERNGVYGYYGRPLAIMVRFPGLFFETTPPPLAAINQLFLIIVSILLILLAVVIWERRRVY